MAKDPATVSELRKAAEVTDQEVEAAVDTVLADLATEAFPLAKGWTLDLVETLRTNTRAAEALTTDKPAWKRNMVRTAILLAIRSRDHTADGTRVNLLRHHIAFRTYPRLLGMQWLRGLGSSEA